MTVQYINTETLGVLGGLKYIRMAIIDRDVILKQ